MMMDRFDSKEEQPEWHPEGFSQGVEARLRGYSMNDKAANPYIGYGSSHWMYKSFCAGWVDTDQAPDAPKSPLRDKISTEGKDGDERERDT